VAQAARQAGLEMRGASAVPLLRMPAVVARAGLAARRADRPVVVVGEDQRFRMELAARAVFSQTPRRRRETPVEAGTVELLVHLARLVRLAAPVRAARIAWQAPSYLEAVVVVVVEAAAPAGAAAKAAVAVAPEVVVRAPTTSRRLSSVTEELGRLAMPAPVAVLAGAVAAAPVEEWEQAAVVVVPVEVRLKSWRREGC